MIHARFEPRTGVSYLFMADGDTHTYHSTFVSVPVWRCSISTSHAAEVRPVSTAATQGWKRQKLAGWTVSCAKSIMRWTNRIRLRLPPTVRAGAENLSVPSLIAELAQSATHRR